MKRVLSFGEILLRLSPTESEKWIHDAHLPAFVGGAELNVAMALARWDVPVRYCTAAPDNYLADSMLQFVRNRGVDTSAVLRSSGRIGIYFLEQGVDLQHAAVIYDRNHSSFSMLQPGAIDWNAVLSGVSHFHFSAISPALNEQVAAVCQEGVEEAERRNIVVSVDLNFRPALWQEGRDRIGVMSRLVENCHIVMGNIWSAAALLGTPVPEQQSGELSMDALCLFARNTSTWIQKKFPACTMVANTFRFNRGERGIDYFATLDHQERQYRSDRYFSSAIVDKVGSGDCFMAGLIYGHFHQLDPNETISLAARAAFMKMYETGDSTNNTISSIQSAALQHEQ